MSVDPPSVISEIKLLGLLSHTGYQSTLEVIKAWVKDVESLGSGL